MARHGCQTAPQATQSATVLLPNWRQSFAILQEMACCLRIWAPAAPALPINATAIVHGEVVLEFQLGPRPCTAQIYPSGCQGADRPSVGIIATPTVNDCDH
ncbi:unnamed protein product [Polarella glacialis]|uniref:Uncharacterized protein n=1 Tax=Polarella glacialis TaxID=89957 RepID=A0A813HF38_POLGL|nr:unnamed protein product [Polarella glacialis]